MSSHPPSDSDSLLSQAGSVAPDCLTVEQLDQYGRQTLSPVDADAIAAHLRACPHCTNELAMLHEFLAGEVPPAQQPDVQYVIKGLEASRTRLLDAAPRKADPMAGSWWRNLFGAFAFPRLALALGTMLVIAGGTLFLRHGRVAPSEDFSESGTFRTARITGVSPAGDITTLPEYISWDDVPGARSYQIRMLEVDGNELWRTTVSTNRVELAQAASIHITYTKTLLLQVSAFSQPGKQIASSEPVRFRLISRKK